MGSKDTNDLTADTPVPDGGGTGSASGEQSHAQHSNATAADTTASSSSHGNDSWSTGPTPPALATPTPVAAGIRSNAIARKWVAAIAAAGVMVGLVAGAATVAYTPVGALLPGSTQSVFSEGEPPGGMFEDGMRPEPGTMPEGGRQEE